LRAKEEELGVWEGKEVGREDDIPFPDLFSCPCSDPHRIIFKGLYVFSYEYYTTFFPAENLHVVTAEQLRVRGGGAGGREGGREGRRGRAIDIETMVGVDVSSLLPSLLHL